MAKKSKYAVVGTGGRYLRYRDAMIGSHAEYVDLVALCDLNEGRLKVSLDYVEEKTGIRPKGYHSDDFERMISEKTPDWILVTTKDSTHDDYICRALELGCKVITEKPMTTDELKCRRILDTQRRTGGRVVVAFNYRYSPTRAQIKDLLMSGVIGEVLSVDFHWLLNTRHGSDYFHRWHRHKENSGGLMVHKATHHFDLVNWWLSSVPETVSAFGHRSFYTPATAERYGLSNRGERCYGCAEAGRCPFFVDISTPDTDMVKSLHRLYFQCEKHDGYFRDRCVFGEDLDLEDSMNLVVAYRSGAKMTYSLNAFSPTEGYTIAFNGTRGRIEHKCEEKVYVSGDGTVPGALVKEGTWTRIFPHWKPAYEVELWTGEGGHGGGDPPLMDDLFHPQPPEDKYLRAADQRAGSWSILTGVAANHSMANGKIIRIEDLVAGIGMPDYPPMPEAGEPLNLPDPDDLARSRG